MHVSEHRLPINESAPPCHFPQLLCSLYPLPDVGVMSWSETAHASEAMQGVKTSRHQVHEEQALQKASCRCRSARSTSRPECRNDHPVSPCVKQMRTAACAAYAARLRHCRPCNINCPFVNGLSAALAGVPSLMTEVWMDSRAAAGTASPDLLAPKLWCVTDPARFRRFLTIHISSEAVAEIIIA